MSMRLRDRAWAPWSGLIAGPIAWSLHHQFGSNAVYLRCAEGDRVFSIALGLALGAFTAAAIWLSLAAQKPAAEQDAETRRFAAWISAAGGALFLLAITFQTAGGLLAPSCAP